MLFSCTYDVSNMSCIFRPNAHVHAREIVSSFLFVVDVSLSLRIMTYKNPCSIRKHDKTGDKGLGITKPIASGPKRSQGEDSR